MTHKPIRKAVFPVAGMGTRLLPATKIMPKEMLTLFDRPLIQHAIEEAAAAGIEEFILVTSRGKNMLEDHFDFHAELEDTLTRKNKSAELTLVQSSTFSENQVKSVRQPQPLGLGHAVWCARHLVGDEPFAVLLPDDVVLSKTPCLQQMTKAYAETGGNLIAVVEVPRNETDRYGILDISEDKGQLVKIKGLVEKPKPDVAPSTLSIIGRYILQPEVFSYLEAKKTGAGGEIQLTDSLAQLIGKQPFHGFRYEGTRYDCGHKLGFIEANVAYGLADSKIGPALRTALSKLL